VNGFASSIGRNGAPLHAAAHSHHPWPDVTLAAQEQAWRDAARLLDRKWEHVFGAVIPAAQAHIARQLRLPDPSSIAFGPNTHGFVMRILSCLPPRPRILTTGSEFISFARQVARLEEDGLAEVMRVSTEPFETFEARFARAAADGGYDLVFLSHVLYDSGFVVRDLAKVVSATTSRKTFVVIDGYHAFMALPADLSAVADRAFYLAGGYKYAMAGEGVCFVHCPPGYGARPRDTGWYAGFGALEHGGGTGYAQDGSRFLGATFDVAGLYRFNAVQDWLKDRTVGEMLDHVRSIERIFLSNITLSPMIADEAMRGRFLAFRTDQANAITRRLAERNIVVDCRADRLRVGFGIYHTADDALRLAANFA